MKSKMTKAVVNTLLANYRGWTIECNPAGLIIAGRPDAGSFPFIAKDVEHAKRVIDDRERAATLPSLLEACEAEREARRG